MSMKIIAPIAAGVLLAMAGAAQAATKTASFQVSANVGKNCVISATNLNLGTFDGDNDLTVDLDHHGPLHERHRLRRRPEHGLVGRLRGPHAREPGARRLVYNLYTDGDLRDDLGRQLARHRPARRHGQRHGEPRHAARCTAGCLPRDNTGPIDAGAYIDTIIATITY